MSIFIGGSGSTGSSLLRQLLNKNSNIYIYNETHLFTKSDLFIDWKISKSKIFKRSIFGLRSSGIKLYTGVDFSDKEIHLSKQEIKQLLMHSSDLFTFCESLFVSKKKPLYWGEKTPANAIHFNEIKNEFPLSKMILCVRSPLDTIASMMARGYSIYYATAVYLLNTAHGINFKDVIIVRYEDLVNHPKKTLQDLCFKLDIQFEENMLVSKPSANEITQLSSWNFDESSEIQRSKNSRYQLLSSQIQDQILVAIKYVSLMDDYVKLNNLKLENIKGIALHCNYEIPEPKNKIKTHLKRQKLLDQIHHTLKAYPIHIFNYPIEIC